jgi:hypothetical protein
VRGIFGYKGENVRGSGVLLNCELSDILESRKIQNCNCESKKKGTFGREICRREEIKMGQIFAAGRWFIIAKWRFYVDSERTFHFQ